ncbi:hypothetical protein BS47DRAFT_1068313 [Hydnum rufescens UP504]|uniref:Protein kinase domain-containing protein n=1 Tax=Hydnum rufescens UP504 TaxID=1448309 RepID=A0A9P6DRN5_9AGAM|nr:hypothetical protein BS47DRAFT_1068313 [Hydnum rufescens UP504]
MNNRGSMEVADFWLARTFGDPLGDMTPLVATLWNRAPEIPLGETSYSTTVDMWSVGCVFGELILKEPVFQAKGEMVNVLINRVPDPDARVMSQQQMLRSMRLRDCVVNLKPSASTVFFAPLPKLFYDSSAPPSIPLYARMLGSWASFGPVAGTAPQSPFNE